MHSDLIRQARALAANIHTTPLARSVLARMADALDAKIEAAPPRQATKK